MLLLILTLIALVLVLTACVTGQWVLLGIIPLAFLLWMTVKFALWAGGRAPAWQNQLKGWWTTTMVPWWTTNSDRVFRGLAVLAIIATLIAIVVCLTVKLGPAMTSGSICPACKGVPTAVVVSSSATASSCVARNETFTRVATVEKPVRIESASKCPLTRTTWGPMEYASYSVRFPTGHGDSTVVFLKDGPHKELPFPLDWMEFAPVGTDSVIMEIRQRHP